METRQNRISWLALYPNILCPSHSHRRYWLAWESDGRSSCYSQQHRFVSFASFNFWNLARSVSLQPVVSIRTVGLFTNLVYIRRRAVNPRLNRKLDIILEIKYHGIVALGMVLTIIAVVHILGGGDISKNKPLLDAGSAISCVAWVLVVLWAVWSHSMNRRFSSYSDMQTSENGKMVSNSEHFIFFSFSQYKLLTNCPLAA